MGLGLTQDLVRENQRLAVGAQVLVRWPHCGYSLQSRGVILRLDWQRAEVRLLTPITGGREVPGVRTLLVPRCTNFMEWSSSWELRLAHG